MSTNSEQMQQNANNDTNLSKKHLFLRVCYRHKSKLRSFECLPSFQQLIDQITRIYPQIKPKLLSTPPNTNNNNKNHKKEEKTNRKQYKWRLQTHNNEWIENEKDWNTTAQYLKQQDSSSNIHLTLTLIINDEETTNYNPEIPSFQKCYKNPLTLIYQRPPPPPYNPPGPTPYTQPIPPQNHALYQPNPYPTAPPYYPYPQTQPQYPVPYAQPITQQPINHHKRPLEDTMTPAPIKKRKLNEEPPITTTVSVPMAMVPAVNVPVNRMPSGPPPPELLNANPYGIVQLDGYVWCDACNGWFEVHCFNSHLTGKKHKKHIDAFSFRKVLKHWQKIRTKVVDDVTKYNIKEISTNNNLWYAQICLSCLTEVHYSSWHQHVRGQVHQNNFAKCPRTVSVNRQLLPGNEGSDMPTLFSSKYFTQISNYVPGSKILVLGEQDFSYSLAVCNLLQSGQNLVGTSYLSAFNPNAREPEEHPSDDAVRANYYRNTLPSHNGQLQHNLRLLAGYGAYIAHDIDGTKLYQCLVNANPKVYCGPFDIIIFPFPRASLKRGLDFRNSTLIQGFFNEIRQRRSELLYPLSQIQMIILDNQFKEWDVTNIGKENGWILKWRCSIDFASLPHYQPRELSGKAWNPKTARLLVFLWDQEFDKKVEGSLDALNEINDLALLPDEAMKVTKQAKILDAYHANGIRQYQDPSLTRLSAPPSSLQR